MMVCYKFLFILYAAFFTLTCKKLLSNFLFFSWFLQPVTVYASSYWQITLEMHASQVFLWLDLGITANFCSLWKLTRMPWVSRVELSLPIHFCISVDFFKLYICNMNYYCYLLLLFLFYIVSSVKESLD